MICDFNREESGQWYRRTRPHFLFYSTTRAFEQVRDAERRFNMGVGFNDSNGIGSKTEDRVKVLLPKRGAAV